MRSLISCRSLQSLKWVLLQFALKFMSKKEVTDVDEVERLFRESAILTSLKCEHIIDLHEVRPVVDLFMSCLNFKL